MQAEAATPLRLERPSVSQRKEAKKDDFRLPSKSSAYKICRIMLRDYNERVASVSALADVTLTEEARQQIIAQYDVIDITKKERKADFEAQKTTLQAYHAELKRLTKKQDRILSQIEKKISFGAKAKDLIFIIVNKIYDEIDAMPKNIQKKYANGELKNYVFTTSTRSLARLLNTLTPQKEAKEPTNSQNQEDDDKDAYGEGSFRGSTGFYAVMKSTGFVLEKKNRKLNGELSSDGYSVNLTIDLDFIFGYSLAISTPAATPKSDTIPSLTAPDAALFGDPKRGNSTHLAYNFSKERTKESGVAIATDFKPTNVGNKNNEAEGRNSKPQSESQGFFAGGGAAGGDIVDKSPESNVTEPKNDLKTAIQVENWAKQATKLLTTRIYTPENLAKNRIRVAQDKIYNFITPQDWEVMLDRMFECYHFINQNRTRDWAKTHEEITQTIEKTASYYEKNSGDWIYSPFHFLRVNMATRSLVFAHELYFAPEAVPSEASGNVAKANFEMLNRQITPLSTLADPHLYVPGADEIEIFENYDWLVKERNAYSLSLSRYARNLGKRTVDDAIRFVRCKYKRGFRSKNDIISYTFGVIRNLQATDAAKMKADADEQETLYKAGIQLGAEYKKQEKQAEKEGNAENDAQPSESVNLQSSTMNQEIDPLSIWVEKVKPIARKVVKKIDGSIITPEQVVKVAHRAMEKSANEDQIFVWCEGIAKGTSKIF